MRETRLVGFVNPLHATIWVGIYWRFIRMLIVPALNIYEVLFDLRLCRADSLYEPVPH